MLPFLTASAFTQCEVLKVLLIFLKKFTSSRRGGKNEFLLTRSSKKLLALMDLLFSLYGDAISS